ncbi:Dyp-type peroxidase [uncultured Piscinibacter sp.]|uniref:Dyp-type peroxidase n=1 Tax=uncultured Piscinibacter sp. TaxID=1131835 RepID=UPI002630B20E|nr:Dyp-type peroxidase [uncultured Piscinibacter sp.]
MRSMVKGQSLAGATNLALMAPVHEHMVPGEETITYLERLRRLLDALHASRRNLREAELDAPVFPDSIGRFDIIQQFRYAIWTAPADGSGQRTSYLTLNVSFDGGWEPYMRVIQRDIGELLDALLCHCPGYPGSRQATFDAYCRWVRDHEMDAGIFYTDSPATAADARYLSGLERIQREERDPVAAQSKAAGFALPSLARQQQEAIAQVKADPGRALALPLRTLKGLYRLVPFFGRQGLTLEREDLVLRRFAQLVLKEFRALVRTLLSGDHHPHLPPPEAKALADRLRPFLMAFEDELQWLCEAEPAEAPAVPGVDRSPYPYDPTRLQDSILQRTDPVTHGCLVLLGVTGAADARAALAAWLKRCGPPADAAAVRWHIGFTHAGLRVLGASATTLDHLPAEFAQGMEARCGILGDLRANHPSRWRRPLRLGAPPEWDDRIDLSAVHAVLVLRKVDPRDASSDLHPDLAAEVAGVTGADNGWRVLAVEPTRSWRRSDGGASTGHFGFADGISQPSFAEPPAAPRPPDQLRAGELLLGHANDRGDEPWSIHRDDPLLRDGSFLVVRKLRQRVDRLEAAKLSDEARAKMMGRWQDGRPLLHPTLPADPASNDFSYGMDAQGRHCPLQSHVRRTNPRDGRSHMPRILRRGMSYGPAMDQADLQTDRGLMFMAYCASIAEQFEVLQHWVAGGNSSGLSSPQSDPFLGVPQAGERRVFRYVDSKGEMQHVELGDQPLVELQWGLYLFVPSLDGLRALAAAPEPATTSRTPGPVPSWDPSGNLESWRMRLESPEPSPATWAEVRRQSGGCAHADGYGELFGSLDAVLQVLRDDGSRYSVAGYATRMGQTIGVNLLGLDANDPQRQAQADAVNGVIDGVDEQQAFEAAWPMVQATIAGFALLDRPPGLPPGDPRVRRPVDLVTLGERVLAGLCKLWFGLPDGTRMVVGGRRPEAPEIGATPRCPGDLFSSSRTIFAPHPPRAVVNRARVEGRNVQTAVAGYLRSAAPRPSLAVAIEEALIGTLGGDHPHLQDVFERNLAGMLLGFPPTVQGNFLQVMKYWIEEGTLWQHQQAIAEAFKHIALDDVDAGAVFRAVEPVLRRRLMATMRRRPVPETLWRSPVVTGGDVDTLDPDKRVIVGVRSALAEVEADAVLDPDDFNELMFGGSRSARSPLHGVHACPGYKLGVGVLLALLAGLLSAGTLQPTGSPVQLMLTPRPRRP